MKTTKKFNPENDYYFNSIVKQKKEQIVNSIDRTKKEIELLKSIKIVTKKDWSEFQNFVKNFNFDWIDWKIYIRSYPFDDEIRISNYPIEIDIYRLSHDPEFLKSIDQSRIINGWVIKDYAYYNVHEFYNEIQKRIENRQKRLEKYENELKDFDNDLKVTIEILKKIYDQFNELNQKMDNWYYTQKEILENTIKHFYL